VKEIDDCEVHKCATVLQTVAVVDALKPGLKATPTYAMARRERFPHSNDVVAGSGVRRSLPSTHIGVCEECCRQRDSFLRSNYPLWLKTHELAS
jgi:hypothetical protein